MPSGNDATSYDVAIENCLYCAIGGLVGKTSTEIMTMVHSMLGSPLPTGANGTGADSFGRLYWKCVEKKPYQEGTNAQPVKYQIAGVKYFMTMKGKSATAFGTAEQPKKFPALLQHANSQPEGTLFLAFAGDADRGTFVTTLAHWTTGQVQGGKATFYDYQTKVSDPNVSQQLADKFRQKGILATVGETRVSGEPMGPLGQELDDEDKRGILLVCK